MSNQACGMMADVFQQSVEYPFSTLHFGNDADRQFQAIVAIHSTALGPALGGCRLVRYTSTNAALTDVLRLAKGMTYKAAFHHLPFGGGKAVIIAPEKIRDRRDLMNAYGDFIDSLGGMFITAVDSGTGPDDMDIVAKRTKHVVCASKQFSGTGDPSPHTAKGVLRGIQAASKYLFKSDQMEGIHVLIQGVGHVGIQLVSLLKTLGAKVSVSDVNQQSIKTCQDRFEVSVVEPEEVYSTPCDVFSPCALGQIINASTAKQLKAKIVAGSANNQLLDGSYGELLRKLGILYAPDYVINSGGLLQIAYRNDQQLMAREIDRLYERLITIFEQSSRQGVSTNVIANQMAEDFLRESKLKHPLPAVHA
ncbi:MAG: Glu/Leu/Phe/Val dehydrogenase [Ectothiorhodospiraceae bacterium]|nr:Glu/Leu/Phe/Val dehydrogenase [Ectothiorhodospiraceae bacterium]